MVYAGYERTNELMFNTVLIQLSVPRLDFIYLLLCCMIEATTIFPCAIPTGIVLDFS